MVRLDLRTAPASGCSATQAFKDCGVRVVLGAWTGVTIDDTLELIFDSGTPWREPSDLDNLTAGDISTAAMAAAAKLMRPEHLEIMRRGIRNAHREGVAQGREDMAKDLRDLIGWRR